MSVFFASIKSSKHYSGKISHHTETKLSFIILFLYGICHILHSKIKTMFVHYYDPKNYTERMKICVAVVVVCVISSGIELVYLFAGKIMCDKCFFRFPDLRIEERPFRDVILCVTISQDTKPKVMNNLFLLAWCDERINFFRVEILRPGKDKQQTFQFSEGVN